jgi:hypothetical protein
MYEYVHPSEMKPSDKAKWDIHKTYICHPIEQGTAANHFPLNGKQSREYVVIIWSGPYRPTTFSMISNYWLKPKVSEHLRKPVQLRLL